MKSLGLAAVLVVISPLILVGAVAGLAVRGVQAGWHAGYAIVDWFAREGTTR